MRRVAFRRWRIGGGREGGFVLAQAFNNRLPEQAGPGAAVSRITCIIWDWNGTLLDDVCASVSALNTLMAPRGLGPETVARYRDRFGFPVRDYYLKAGFDLPSEDWEHLARDYHDAYLAQPGLRLFDDARPVLNTLAACGIRQALLSSCEQSILERLLGEVRLTGCFSHICGADNLHGLSKAERGRALVRDLGCASASTLFVGDTLHDHDVAAELGCRCVLVARGHQSRERLLAAGRPVIDRLDDLPRLIAEGTC
jgi:phosphoglycolate phosphatase